MIEVNSLFFSYQKIPVLSGIDLSLYREKNLILSGVSGAGKTTLIRLIAGLEVPDSGVIKIDEKVMNDGDKIVLPSQRSIGIVFQQPALWPHMSVKAHLDFVNHNPYDQKVRNLRLLKAVGLEPLADRYPGQLSEGQAHRLGIARALAAQPRYLIMDEPFASLDPETKDEMIQLVRSESAALGAGLLLITHDDREASLIGGERLWMREGKLWGEQKTRFSFSEGS